MIDFRTYGRISLRAEDGTELTSVLVQPKRVALLVYLAAARPHGYHRRDTLVGLLWPELDQERARAALRKALHYLRRALGEEAIISRGDDELALNTALIACDARGFDDAVAQGEASRALEQYHGPFMDGFFVRDAAGFEDWCERERQRYHQAAFRAAWQLAEQAEQTGDAFGAAHWARHAASVAPDDEGALRGLMSMLDRLGDRAGAVAAYDEFARRLAREYDIEPATETRALLNRVRTSDAGVTQVADAAPAEEETASSLEIIAAPEQTRAPKPRRTTVAVVLATVMIVIALAGGRRVLDRRAAAPTSADVVAVMPFSFQGSAEHEYLSAGMVNLLAANLDHAGDMRAVEGPIAAENGAATVALDAQRASAIARQLGAGMVVVGDIVEVAGRLRVTADLYDAALPSRRIARGHAEGPVAQLFELVDEVTAELVAGQRRAPAERFTRLAALTTTSIPALKSYLTGEQQFRAGRYNEAVESFQAAVDADTSFALGYYRLALAHMWGSNDSDRIAAQSAIRHGARLASPERALLEALMPFFEGRADEAERRYRDILVRRPEESEVWYPLGEVLFHHNPIRGRGVGEAKHAFERALNLGPKDGPLTHLIEIAAIERDYVAFDSLFTGIGPASHFHYVGRLVQGLVHGDANARTHALAELRDSTDARLLTAARHAVFLLEDYDDIAPVIALLTEPTRPRVLRSWGHVHSAHLDAGAGRFAAARAALADAAPFDAARALEHEAFLLTLPFAPATRADLSAMLQRLAAATATHDTVPASDLVLTGDRDARAHVHQYLKGLLHARLGEDAAALRMADALERAQGLPVARELALDLSHAVRAEVLRMNNRAADALAELERTRIGFDANRLNIAPFYAQVRERYVRAELLAAVGRREEALGWFGSFDEHGPWGRALLAPAALQQARIHDGLGNTGAAMRQYARFVHLWKNAEPPLRPLVTQAEQRLAELRSRQR